MSEGNMDRFGVASMYRAFTEAMQDSSPTDFILLTGLSVMSGIACSCFAYKHGFLNLLLFKNNEYIERVLKMDELITTVRR